VFRQAPTARTLRLSARKVTDSVCERRANADPFTILPVGGSLGAAIALPINSSLNMNPAVALIRFTALGAAIGCCASVFIDVFVANHED
jgi:hypothetical protein